MALAKTLLQSRRRAAGFTLAELLMGFALMGALGAASYPFFVRSTWLSVKAGAGDILGSFRLARSRAIAARANVYVAFFVGGGENGRGFYTVFLDKDGNRQLDPGEDEASGVPQPERWHGWLGRELPRGVSFGAGGVSEGPRGTEIPDDGIAFSGGTNRLGFYPKGNTGSGTVYLCDRQGNVRAVRVLLSGAIEGWTWRMEASKWVLG